MVESFPQPSAAATTCLAMFFMTYSLTREPQCNALASLVICCLGLLYEVHASTVPLMLITQITATL